MRFAPITLAFLSSLAIVTANPPLTGEGTLPHTAKNKALGDPDSMAHHLLQGTLHKAATIHEAEKGNPDSASAQNVLAVFHIDRYWMAKDLHDHQREVDRDPFYVGTAKLNYHLDHPSAPEHSTAWVNRHEREARKHTAAHALACTRAWQGIDPESNRLLADKHAKAAFANKKHAGFHYGNAFLTQGAIAVSKARIESGAQAGPQAGAGY